MPDEPQGSNAAPEPPPVLDRKVQDYLGQKLRAAYAEAEKKPNYLGDPALPPQFEQQVLAIEKSAEVHEKAIEAVRDALGVPAPAHEKGVAAVADALGVPEPPTEAAD